MLIVSMRNAIAPPSKTTATVRTVCELCNTIMKLFNLYLFCSHFCSYLLRKYKIEMLTVKVSFSIAARQTAEFRFNRWHFASLSHAHSNTADATNACTQNTPPVTRTVNFRKTINYKSGRKFYDALYMNSRQWVNTLTHSQLPMTLVT